MLYLETSHANVSARYSRIAKHIVNLNPRALKLLDLNAQFMEGAEYTQLVGNIKADGCLTGNTPFAWLLHDDRTRLPIDPPVYEVLSGNHRVRASIDAGLDEITIEATDQYLTPARRAAIQLAHNAIVGRSDPATLKLIFQSIDDVGLRMYTGLDDKLLGLLPDAGVAPLSEAALEFQTISLTFLPDEAESAAAALDRARKAAGKTDGYWLARWSDYDRTMDAAEAAGQAHGVKNTATALMLVLDVFEQHAEDLAVGYAGATGQRRVPTVSALGYTLPVALANKLRALPGDDKVAALESVLDQHAKGAASGAQGGQ